MAVPSRRLCCFVLVSLYCLAKAGFVIAGDIDGLSSKIDADLFLEDEGSGMGSRGMDDLEISGSGNGEDDEDAARHHDRDRDRHPPPPPPKTTPRSMIPEVSEPDRKGASADPDADINFPNGGEGGSSTNVLSPKDDYPASFFSQPGILAAIICGAIVGLLCAILLVMFIVYRMRKKDEGSYVLDDSKRTTPSYGKAKEFFA